MVHWRSVARKWYQKAWYVLRNIHASTQTPSTLILNQIKNDRYNEPSKCELRRHSAVLCLQFRKLRGNGGLGTKGELCTDMDRARVYCILITNIFPHALYFS